MRFRKKSMKISKRSFVTNLKSKNIFYFRSERKMNEDFGVNIQNIVSKMIESYNEQTTGYIVE
jgi:hypothetical protein